VRLLPDEERAQSLWLLGLDRNVSHDGQIGPAARPLDQAVNVLGRSFEDCLNPAVGKVAHPPAHTALTGPSPAGVTEVDALDLTGDEHSIADHRPGWVADALACGEVAAPGGLRDGVLSGQVGKVAVEDRPVFDVPDLGGFGLAEGHVLSRLRRVPDDPV
jgi:hypothetical protein